MYHFSFWDGLGQTLWLAKVVSVASRMAGYKCKDFQYASVVPYLGSLLFTTGTIVSFVEHYPFSGNHFTNFD